MDDVFDPGYSGTDEWTGFGLTIVEEVIDAHGWTVDVTESDSGRAHFQITGVEISIVQKILARSSGR